VLAMIRQGYGPQNSIDKVFFSDSDDAVIFIKSSDGTIPLMVNLTVLATLRADGTIPSDDELKRQWLHL
jgi:hypothetical protein